MSKSWRYYGTRSMPSEVQFTHLQMSAFQAALKWRGCDCSGIIIDIKNVAVCADNSFRCRMRVRISLEAVDQTFPPRASMNERFAIFWQLRRAICAVRHLANVLLRVAIHGNNMWVTGSRSRFLQVNHTTDSTKSSARREGLFVNNVHVPVVFMACSMVFLER